MFGRLLVPATLGMLLLAFVSCASAPPEEAAKPAEVAKPVVEAEVSYYELTKDDITSKADWTSRNITLKGAKIGDKTTAVEKSFGKLDKGDTLGDHIRTIYEGSKYAIYTFKMTGELQKIEVLSPYAEQISDPKLKKLLSSGDLAYMRELLGPEASMDFNPLTAAEEYNYPARGVRFAKYLGVKLNSLIFYKVTKKN